MGRIVEGESPMYCHPGGAVSGVQVLADGIVHGAQVGKGETAEVIFAAFDQHAAIGQNGCEAMA